MAASYNNRPPGSRSGSLEIIDEPPSYVNRAYAPTGAPAAGGASATAAAASQAAALAYGRRYQPNVTTSTSGQRLYSEQPVRSMSTSSQPPDQGYYGGSLYDDQRPTASSGAAARQQPRSQSPGRYLEEGVPGGRSGGGPQQPPLYGAGRASPGSHYAQQAPSGRVASANAGYYAEAPTPARPSGHHGRLYSQKPYYPGYNSARYGRPKHTSVTREPGYYNLNTDTVVRAKKHRNKTFLYVGRPWTKGFSTAPRDFLPLAVVAIFFCPPLGVAALVLSLLSRRSVRKEDFATAGYRGRIAFWVSVSSVIVGVVCWIVIVAAINGYRFIGHRIH